MTGFKELTFDLWKRRRDEVEGRNHALRNLLGQFGATGARQGAFIRAVQRMDDPSRIRAFDEMVEYAQRYHPELLHYEGGEFAGADDAEQALFSRLKTGLEEAPALWSDDVIGEAIDYVDSAERSLRNATIDSEYWDQVAFARRRSAAWWTAIRYAARYAQEAYQT